MALRTALTDLLGIEHPIVLAPMGGVAGDLITELDTASAVVARIADEAAKAISTAHAATRPGTPAA
jgi:hypothetical protein